MPVVKQSRLIIAKMVLSMIHHFNVSLLYNKGTAHNANDVVIVLGVAVGVHENKPMTAAKLALYISMPRPTVIRRVQLLVERNILVINSNKQIILSELTNINALNLLHTLNKPAILRAAKFVSKMDTLPIETTKRK